MLTYKNKKKRLGALGGAEEVKKHPWFEDIDWDAIMEMDTEVPYKPNTEGQKYLDNFDSQFTREDPINSIVDTNPALLKELNDMFKKSGHHVQIGIYS